MMQREAYAWYAELSKPLWAPEAWLFGPVWAVLYVIIAVSFGYVLVQYLRGSLPVQVLVPFVLNLLFNLLFSPVQFGLENLELATLVIVLVLGTLIWAQVAIWRYARWVVLVNIPYLLWVSFATVLQVTIMVMNW